MITLRLTSYNMGDVNSADFDHLVDFVTENLPRHIGDLEVEVGAYRFGESVDRDTITGATDEQEEAIREALRTLWDEFCSHGWDAAIKAARK